MHRAAIKAICGLHVKAGRVSVRPHLSSHWPRITLKLQLAGQRLELIVCAAWASQQITQVRQTGTEELGEDEWLDLTALGEIESRLVVAGVAESPQHQKPAKSTP